MMYWQEPVIDGRSSASILHEGLFISLFLQTVSIGLRYQSPDAKEGFATLFREAATAS